MSVSTENEFTISLNELKSAVNHHFDLPVDTALMAGREECVPMPNHALPSFKSTDRKTFFRLKVGNKFLVVVSYAPETLEYRLVLNPNYASRFDASPFHIEVLDFAVEYFSSEGMDPEVQVWKLQKGASK